MASEARYFIGTCGYSYPGAPPNGWSCVFYPKVGGKRVDALEFYAAHFNCVEINSTFYRPASAAMARGWLAKTSAAFHFYSESLAEIYPSPRTRPRKPRPMFLSTTTPAVRQ